MTALAKVERAKHPGKGKVASTGLTSLLDTLGLNRQAAFVAWWDANVTPNDEATRFGNNPKAIPAKTSISAADATAQTGISVQQVSRWRG